jgi:hypothetical protein
MPSIGIVIVIESAHPSGVIGVDIPTKRNSAVRIWGYIHPVWIPISIRLIISIFKPGIITVIVFFSILINGFTGIG